MELNGFFSNALINLKFPKFENFDPFSENIDHQCVKSVQIRSFFWSVFSRIRTEYGEIRMYVCMYVCNIYL